MEKVPELHTKSEIHAYIEQEAARQLAAMHDKADHIFRAKNAVWLLLLVVVFLQYYLILTLIEANSINDLGVHLPVNFQMRSCPANAEHKPANTQRRSQAFANPVPASIA